MPSVSSITTTIQATYLDQVQVQVPKASEEVQMTARKNEQKDQESTRSK